MKKRKLGFSLIELLVVIAIIAILAAVASPYYLKQVNATKVNNAYRWVQRMMQIGFVDYYQMQDKFPPTLTYQGFSMAINSGGFYNDITSLNTNITLLGIQTFNTPAVMVMFVVSGLKGVPNYPNPLPTSFPQKNSILAAKVYVDGMWKTICGQSPNYLGSDGWLDTSAMPPQCSCSDVWLAATTGVLGSGC